jgi:hypothetical protein
MAAMSWVNDLVSAAGLPAGAATLAVAMYAACVAAEKAARPEALQEIGRILEDTSWSRSAQASTIVQRIFNLTFGEQHFSKKCLRRSAMATIIVYVMFAAVLFFEGHQFLLPKSVSEIALYFYLILYFGFAPDYLSLGKTRVLLSMRPKTRNIAFGFILVFVDILASAAIIAGTLFILFSPDFSIIKTTIDLYQDDIIGLWTGKPTSVFSIMLFSTLFTSVWTILILLSTALLKLLAPVQRFTGWFFDVEKHPIQAIGIVSGFLLVLGSAIWTVVRSIV